MPFHLRAASPALALAAIAAPWAQASPALAADPVQLAPLTIAGRTIQAPPLATRALTAEEISHTVNAVTAEDAIRYLPAILARRRHIGDTQAPIATRTSGVGASARSLVYADGVLISALIGNNNANASPRWGMVSPSEIEGVSVSYGPFQAAYPGNSIGAVVEITTRTPSGFEAAADATYARQRFAQYGLDDAYESRAGALAVGDRRGPVWWRASYARLVSDGQPLSYVTATRAGGAPAAGLAGAYADVNRAGQPIAVAGAAGLEHQAQDLAKLKLGVDLGPALQASWVVGYFGQRDDAHAQTFLRDAAGRPAWSGVASLGGAAYSFSPTAFAGGVYRLDEAHWMQAVSLSGQPGSGLDWKARASVYDYARDRQRTPGALPVGFSGGAGTILDLAGTGWRTLDLEGGWRGGRQRLRAGLHLDRYQLKSRRYAADDWRDGPPGALTQLSLGRTTTAALWVEGAIHLSPELDLTVGGRLERWRADQGRNLSGAADVRQPARARAGASPKLVLAWRRQAWRASLSAGAARRFPTVTELYQLVTDGQTQRSPDPNLRPERARSAELSAVRTFGPGDASSLRLSLFAEDIHDALIAQATPLPGGSGASVNFVQNVGEVRSKGVEAVFDGRDLLAPGLDLTVSATIVDSRIVTNAALPAAVGKRAPQVPRLRWTAVASWRATPRLTLSAAARYSDRSFATLDNSDTVSHTWQGFDGYLAADVRASFRLDAHWSAALGVDNLTNRRYYLFHPFPGRTVMAQLSYRLAP